ncbi:MAG: hypothetical protein GY833_06740 [Aestuariibacter sp.]|nr:hypothetical protein [Aestuariibacter sp.]
MTNAAFKLEDSGFTRQQVNALTDFMDGSVATKADIERLDGKITAEIAELSGEIKNVRTELSGEISNVRTELIGKINLLYWMLGVSVAGTASLVIKAFST